MKNYSRIYGILMILVIGVFIIFEISSLSVNFQMGLENEIDINETANLRFSTILRNTVKMLNNPTTVNDEELMAYLCDSIYRGMENHEVIYIAFDNKNSLYESRLFDNQIGDILVYSRIDELYTEYFKRGDRRYMQITNRIEVLDNPIYIRTILDISDIYLEREILLSRYRIIVIMVFILLAMGLYFVTTSFEKNIRISEKMKQVEEASKRQEAFSACFAHECKTPLTSIIGYSDMLRTMELSENERKESAEYIFGQGKRLERLTKQMMMLSNLGEGENVKQNVDVMVLIENVLKAANMQMQKKNIVVTVSIETDTIVGEYDLYQSMMTNILDNARKACDQDGKIDLSGRKQGDYYQIKVTDNGCGMNSETVKKMTEPFYMADKARTRQEGGAGLGMTIVRKIADTFNVKLGVQSELGKGTTVSLLIPRA